MKMFNNIGVCEIVFFLQNEVCGNTHTKHMVVTNASPDITQNTGKSNSLDFDDC